MTKTKLLLFDIGGVLVELGGMSTMHAWTDNQYNDEALMEIWLGSPTVRKFESGNCTSQQFAFAITREMNLPVSPAEFTKEFTIWPSQTFPGVKHLLRQLRKHYQLVSLSNTNQLHWPRIMQTFGLETYFDHHFPSHLTGLLKPDQASFKQVLQQFNITPSAITFFDDSPTNIKAANMLGISAVQTKGIEELKTALDSLGLLKVA